MKHLAHLCGCAALAAAAAVGASSCSGKSDRQNPFMQDYDTPYQIPPFDVIEVSDFEPAFHAGIAEARANVDSIANNPEAPTFDNTIRPLDFLSPTLERVMRVLSLKSEADGTPEIEALNEKLMPQYMAFNDELMMNAPLFARIKALHDSPDTAALPEAQRRALDKAYRDFTLNGALLNDQQKDSLKSLNNDLTNLYLRFNKNLLASNNAFEIVVDNQADLEGLPQQTIDNAAAEAKERGKEGKWVFTLHAPSRMAVLQYAKNRALREKMWRGYTSNASSGELDNRPIIADILKKRTQKARLLGFDNYASYATADKMARTPEAARALLMSIWEPAKAKVGREVADMQAIADAEGANITIEPWDYYYYADKVRQKRYALEENAIAPYFAADSVRKGLFAMANRLYGLNFTEMPEAPKYHPDVKVYDVTDADGKHLAVYMTDYYTRPSKRQGAWMEEMASSWVDPDGTAHRPIIYNVCNFSKPAGGNPSLLTIDDVQTTFHEFGHALHGMLSRVPLKSQSGTAVDRDFVEFPSQFHEHWAFDPELLKEYAHHYKTGELIPDSLVAKINAASKHNMGFMTAELSSAALLDLAFGTFTPAPGDSVDAVAFQDKVAADLGMPSQLTFRYRAPYFKHIFGDEGYASGYYTYLWAETLDADAYDMYRKAGDSFSPEVAARVKHVLESGDTRDAMTLYREMAGHNPDAGALLRQRGLAE